jgi:hypothetical protein
MGSAQITTVCELDESDFNIDKLHQEFAKHGIFPHHYRFNSDEGEFESFTTEFANSLAEIEISATVGFTRGRMYMPNGDPGYPDEEEFEDFMVGEKYTFMGKPINIQDCLRQKSLDRLEQMIWEKAAEDAQHEQEYEND